MRRIPVMILAIWMSVLAGCAKSAHQTGHDLLDRLLPADVRRHIDPSVTFSDLVASPTTYAGRTVMVGGIVLGTKRAKDRTEIEVLQLPTDSGVAPSGDRTRSEGRFLAVENKFLDPATIESGTPVTIVGEVTGAMTRSLDDSHYTYPVIEIAQLIDWNKTLPADYAGGVPYPNPYYRGYYGPYGNPYWGGAYGYYPYWGPYYPLLFGTPTPAPSMPPPQSVPPQFRRRD